MTRSVRHLAISLIGPILGIALAGCVTQTAHHNYCRAEGCNSVIAGNLRNIEIDPQNATSWYFLGAGYLGQERWAEAAEPFQRVIAMPTASTEELAGAHYQTGSLLQRRNACEEALASYDRAMETFPGSDWEVWSHYGKGRCYSQLGRHREAIDAYRKHVAFETTHPQHMRFPNRYELLSDSYKVLGRLDAAEAALDNSVRLVPDYIPGHLLRAWLHLERGAYERAQQDIRRIGIDLAEPILSASARGALAFAKLNLGAPQGEVFDLLEQARQIHPDYPYDDQVAAVHYALGDLQLAQDRMPKRGFLGVYTQASASPGQLVTFIIPNTPAESAGLRAGDLILAVDGRAIETSEELVDVIGPVTPGTRVELSLERAGQPLSRSAHVGDRLEHTGYIARALAKRRMSEEAERLVKEGLHRGALNLYLDRVSERPLDPDEVRAVIRLARNTVPPPAVPDRARRHAVRARTLVQEAVNQKDFRRAVSEYEQALRIAPWWTEARYYFALVQEEAGDPAAAIESLRLVLSGEPDPDTVLTVRNKMYSLEIKAEKVAVFKRWEGHWSTGDNHYSLTVDGDKARLVWVKMGETSANAGYSVGDLDTEGTIDGNSLTGLSYWRTSDSDTSRCFGNPYPIKTTAVLSEDGNELTETVYFNRYTVATCAIVKTTPKNVVFKRIPSPDDPAVPASAGSY
jgi:tetratricopeptide (TPR) repeat protein